MGGHMAAALAGLPCLSTIFCLRAAPYTENGKHWIQQTQRAERQKVIFFVAANDPGTRVFHREGDGMNMDPKIRLTGIYSTDNEVYNTPEYKRRVETSYANTYPEKMWRGLFPPHEYEKTRTTR